MGLERMRVECVGKEVRFRSFPQRFDIVRGIFWHF